MQPSSPAAQQPSSPAAQQPDHRSDIPHRGFGHATAALVAVFAVTMTTGAVGGDCFTEGVRPYRVIEIDPIGQPISLDLALGVSATAQPIRRLTFGMNQHLELVFFAVDPSTSGGVRSFVHLPVAAYGLAAGTHELPIPGTAPGGGLVVVATDINDDGVIVGFVGDAVSFEEMTSGVVEAFVWRLADSTQSTPAAIQPGESIHPTSLDDVGCISAAWGVSDADPPMIVGGAALRFCAWPGCSYDDPVYAFGISLGTPSSAVWLPGNGDGESRAYAVSTAATPLAVGLDLADEPFDPDPPLGQPCGPPIIEIGCPWQGEPPPPLVSPADATTWLLSGTPSLGLLAPLDGAEAPGAAAGVDEAGHIVGDSGCTGFRRATFWEDAGASPWDLAAVCGNDAIGRADDVVTVLVCDETEELVMAVGGDFIDRARLWARFDGQWCCDALSDRVLPTSTVGDGEYDVEYAHAVARSGQMIAHGRPRGATSGTPFSAYLLTCAADFNGDGRIDGADLGALLNLWGTCPSSGPCPGNLNPETDDVVDGADLGALLNSWSGDERCTVGPSVTCPTSMLEGGMSFADAFAQATEFLGFADTDELAAWFATADEPSRDGVLVSIVSIMTAAQLAAEE